MKLSIGAGTGIAIAIALALWSGAAQARCTINSAGLSITPLTASTGTYTPPTAPTAQAVTFTISGTYTTTATAGTCRAAISFNRATLPASMARSGGGTAMPYTARSTATGGNTLLFTGGGTPTATNYLLYSFTAAGANLTNRAFTATLTAYFLAQPVASQPAGSYSDSLTLGVYNVSNGGTVTTLITRTFTVSGTVAKVCSIGGVAHPTADSATIPVTSAGAVNTAVINRSYASVTCNTPSNVQLTSQNGGVKTSGTPPSGFTNIINYSATATFSGAMASVNTATNPAATGAEAGAVVSTTGTTPTGTMSVAITPQANAQRLLTGTYADTLTITITPQ